ncbi:glycosyltransferase family 2 protein [Spirosoma humi]
MISIITVVYNDHSKLEKTILSVLQQQKDLFEYWIIDGGSTDGSVDVIKRYNDRLAGWISEPDSGIYEAMNKGVNMSKGEWVYFLGSNDVLEPNILSQLSPYLSHDAMVVYGDVYIGDNKFRYPSAFGLRTMLQNTVHHQGAFYSRKLFQTFRYDTKLKILSDYELNMHVYFNKMPYKKFPFVVASCSEGGVSGEIPLSIFETNLIRSRYIKANSTNWILSTVLRLYYAQKQLRALLLK